MPIAHNNGTSYGGTAGRDGTPMTLESFKSKVSRYWKLEALRGALFVMLMGAAAVPTVFVDRRLDRAGFDATAIAVVSAAYFVIAGLMLYVLAPLRRKHLRKLQAGCSACGRLLLGQHANSVIATGLCPACGNQVVNGTAPQQGRGDRPSGNGLGGMLACFTVAAALVCGGAGCSRGYKLGASITPQDLTNALPEFVFVLPAGATNLYLEHTTPHPRLTRTLYKVSVPFSGLTNFLLGFGLAGEFSRMPTQTLALMKQPLTLPGLSGGGIANWAANMPRETRHAAEWNPHKAKAPLRMYLNARPAVSPGEQVVMVPYVDDSSTGQAIVYLDYMRARMPKR